MADITKEMNSKVRDSDGPTTKEKPTKNPARFDTRFTDSEHPMLIVRDEWMSPISHHTIAIEARVFIHRSHGIWDVILPKRNLKKKEWWFNDVIEGDTLVICENRYEILRDDVGDWYIE